MLHREQLSYRITSSSVKPRFTDPDSPFLLESAGELIRLYAAALEEQMTCGELDEMTSAFIRSSSDVKIASGLNKLLLDRCEFSPAAKYDYPEIRKQSFLQAAELIKTGKFTADTLRQCAAADDLYGDLPDFEKLLSFKNISAAALLHRYNLAQAQGLLIYAENVTLTISDTPPEELRKLLKAIKFFRLLGKFQQKDKKTLLITISGPYSLFGTAAKYAVQLANLLPAIVNLPHWKLSASIKLRNRLLTLNLSEKNHLVSHYRSLAAYIPPEIRLFHQTFNQKQSDWQIIGNTPFIDGGDQQLIFPDLSFESLNRGTIIHVELFHKWHAAELRQRIRLLHEKPHLPLLLGIDRSLVKDENDFDSLFMQAQDVKTKCWLFRDFPGVTSTVNRLEEACRRK